MKDLVPVAELMQTFAILDDCGRRWSVEMRFKLTRDFENDLQSAPMFANRTMVPAVCPTGLLITGLRKVSTKFAADLQQRFTDPEMIGRIQQHIDHEEKWRQEWARRRAALARAVESMFQPLTDANPTDDTPGTP